MAATASDPVEGHHTTDTLIYPEHVDPSLFEPLVSYKSKAVTAVRDYKYWGGDTQPWRNGVDDSAVADEDVIRVESKHKFAAETEDQERSGSPAAHSEMLRGRGLRVDFLLALTFALDLWAWRTWEVVQYLVCVVGVAGGGGLAGGKSFTRTRFEPTLPKTHTHTGQASDGGPRAVPIRRPSLRAAVRGGRDRVSQVRGAREGTHAPLTSHPRRPPGTPTPTARSTPLYTLSHCWGGKWGDLIAAVCAGASTKRCVVSGGDGQGGRIRFALFTAPDHHRSPPVDRPVCCPSVAR